jgi:hypothetical protein
MLFLLATTPERRDQVRHKYVEQNPPPYDRISLYFFLKRYPKRLELDERLNS